MCISRIPSQTEEYRPIPASSQGEQIAEADAAKIESKAKYGRSVRRMLREPVPALANRRASVAEEHSPPLAHTISATA